MANEPHTNEPPLRADVMAFAGRIFGAACQGESTQLLAAVDAGLPVDLANDRGILSCTVSVTSVTQVAFDTLRVYTFDAGNLCGPPRALARIAQTWGGSESIERYGTITDRSGSMPRLRRNSTAPCQKWCRLSSRKTECNPIGAHVWEEWHDGSLGS